MQQWMSSKRGSRITRYQTIFPNLKLNGDAEGSREQMLTGHRQLSNISQEFIRLIRDEDNQQEPVLDRKSDYGSKIDGLIQKLFNAIREYEKQAGEEIFDAFKPDAHINIPDDDPQALDVQNASTDLDAALDESSAQADRILKPDSENADRLKRQLVSAKGTNLLIGISVHLKTEAGEWYTRLVNSLRDYEAHLTNAVKRLERGSDIVAGFEDAVDEGITKTIETVCFQLGRTTRAAMKMINRLHKETLQKIPPIDPEVQKAAEAKATELLRRNKAVPDDVALNVRTLDLMDTEFSETTLLANMKWLHTINLNSTQIADLSPLSGLNTLQILWLNDTKTTNWSPVVHIENVQGRPKDWDE